MNILMIGHKYVPSREGGIEIVVEELATRMVKLGHNVTLFNRKRKEYKKIDSYKGINIKEIFTVNKKSLDAIVYSYFATRKAYKMAKKGLVDVIHFHAEGPCIFLNKFKRLDSKKRLRNVKIVVTIHGLDWQRGKWGGIATKMLLYGEKQAVKYADDIIVLSKNNQEYFFKQYNRKTNYIPNGIDIPNIIPADQIIKKFSIFPKEYVLFLARIVPEKGLHYLLSAWKSLPTQIKGNKKLVIAGSSSHSSTYYNKIVENCKNDSSIIMTGFVTGTILKELYSNAYIYVLPSDLEGMPMSLLEAMSYKDICLVSDIKENVEIINKNCITFRAGNIEDLKDKLTYLLTELPTVTSNLNLTSWDVVVQQTIKLYKEEL